MPTIFVANSAVSKPMSLASRLWTLMTAPFWIWRLKRKLSRLGSEQPSKPARPTEDDQISSNSPWL